MGKEQSMNKFKCGGEFNNGSYPPSNTIIMTKDKEGIALKGVTLQNYNAELVHRIEELREKRDEIKRIVELEEEEKTNIQKDLVILNKRITELDESLSRNYAYSNGYDKTIHEVEVAYSKILESSQTLLHVLKSETIQAIKR
ncbi:unnamed protein product [Sphagnum troendelagicum]|uniref:Sjoegren syndrome nuclear autoantigen 1 n=1 Tax=Sphagnum troendelagicum TaxID=128251 RepID=A0ABP0UQB7_9BRYO